MKNFNFEIRDDYDVTCTTSIVFLHTNRAWIHLLPQYFDSKGEYVEYFEGVLRAILQR